MCTTDNVIELHQSTDIQQPFTKCLINVPSINKKVRHGVVQGTTNQGHIRPTGTEREPT